MRIRPATWADLDAFKDLPSRPTVKAWCGVSDGQVVAIGGFYFHQGRWFGFCDLKEEAARHKVAIVKAARKAMRQMRDSGHRFIYAEHDPKFPKAPRWFQSLGFEKQESGYWRWQA